MVVAAFTSVSLADAATLQDITNTSTALILPLLQHHSSQDDLSALFPLTSLQTQAQPIASLSRTTSHCVKKQITTFKMSCDSQSCTKTEPQDKLS